MPWKHITAIIPLIISSSIYALVEQKIDEKQPLPLVFSRSSHNRISIENGGVEKIFGDESYFNISIDKTTGNAFVNVLREIPQPLTLTVVTSAGLIQDLLITSADTHSEHLILKATEEEEELIQTTANLHGCTIDFLNKILEGKIPLGYGQRELRDRDTLNLPQPLEASTIKAMEGPYEDILVYSIKNTGSDSIIMAADSLKKGEASWVFLNAHELRGKQQALCVISFPKQEG